MIGTCSRLPARDRSACWGSSRRPHSPLAITRGRRPKARLLSRPRFAKRLGVSLTAISPDSIAAALKKVARTRHISPPQASSRMSRRERILSDRCAAPRPAPRLRVQDRLPRSLVLSCGGSSSRRSTPPRVSGDCQGLARVELPKLTSRFARLCLHIRDGNAD